MMECAFLDDGNATASKTVMVAKTKRNVGTWEITQFNATPTSSHVTMEDAFYQHGCAMVIRTVLGEKMKSAVI